MTALPVSVIVVSRHRATALRLCVLALQQQNHPAVEVIVVADPAGIAAVAGFGVKTVIFDEANISAARNAGLALAAAPVVAFIDDDAVAEPTWLSRVVAPFADPKVLAATGFVRGRNGISRQWGAAWVDRRGADHPFDLAEAGAVFDAGAGRAIKTQGTNCAFRRDAVLALGGFDPAYRFYHDETDLNLRMMARTAVVPLAQVVHGFAVSERRHANRVPRSLVEIAASSAVFLRRHAPEALDKTAYAALRAHQAERLAHHQRAGRIGRAGVAGLMAGLADGWAEGMARDLPLLTPIAATRTAFMPLAGVGARKGVVLTSRLWGRARAKAQAEAAVRAGQIVTLICISLTARPHRLRFTESGYWLHEGGIFGRSDRDGPRLRFGTLRRRVAEERARWAKLRPVDEG